MLDSAAAGAEHLLFVIIWIGFAVLSRRSCGGRVRLDRLAQAHRQDPADHKTVFTLLSWATFGVLLLGRHVWGWRGRWLRWTLTGFGFLILAYRQPVRAGNDSASGLNVGKLLFWIVIIIAVLCVARIAARMAAARDAPGFPAQAARPARRGAEAMVRCAHCGIHLPARKRCCRTAAPGAAPTTRSAAPGK